MLAAISATLLVNLADVRYFTLVTVHPFHVDNDVRRLGSPELSALPSGFMLMAQDSGKNLGLVWPLQVEPMADAVRVQAQVALEGVGAGEKPWHRAMVSVRTVSAQGKAQERVAFLGAGTQGLTVDAVIQVPPETAELQLMVRLLSVPGAFSVQNLRFDWLVERAWVPLAILALWVCWLLAFSALLVHWLSYARYRAMLVLSFALVLTAVLLPGEWSSALRQQVPVLLNDWLPTWTGWSLPQADGRGLSDYVHFFMFFLLGAALTVARRDLTAWHLIGSLILLGAATEVVQFLVPGREAGWLDVGLNTAGAVLGVGLMRICAGLMVGFGKRD